MAASMTCLTMKHCLFARYYASSRGRHMKHREIMFVEFGKHILITSFSCLYFSCHKHKLRNRILAF